MPVHQKTLRFYGSQFTLMLPFGEVTLRLLQRTMSLKMVTNNKSESINFCYRNILLCQTNNQPMSHVLATSEFRDLKRSLLQQ